MMVRTPKELLNFKIIKEIGNGKTGKGFLAKDKVLNRNAAVKFYNGYPATDPCTITDFQAQVEKIATLNHKNIAQIYSAGFLSDNTPYAIYEYINGNSLSDNYWDKSAILRQIIEGMSYAHKKGIIHGDLHKNNILITKNKVVKIIDFFGQYGSGITYNNEIKMIRTCYKFIDDRELISFLDHEMIKNLKPTSTTRILVQLGTLQEGLQRYRDQIHMDSIALPHYWTFTITEYPIFKIKKILKYIKTEDLCDNKEFSSYLLNRIQLNLSKWKLQKTISPFKCEIQEMNNIVDIYNEYKAIAFDNIFKDDFIQ